MMTSFLQRPGWLCGCAVLLTLAAPCATAQLTESTAGAFEIRQEYTFDGTPDQIWDALTGDISGWWDHSFSGDPAAFFIEPRPGGGFFEYFDAERRDGVLHGTVIFARRPEKLTYRGPLGFSGNALDLVVTYELHAMADGDAPGTRLELFVSGAGRLKDGWPKSVDDVWRHFIGKRFSDYVARGCHRSSDCPRSK